MGTKLNPGQYDCYAKLEPDEPYFLLCSKDPIGEYLVSAWVALRAGDVAAAKRIMENAGKAWKESGRTNLPYGSGKSLEAQQCAEAMRDWQQKIKKRAAETARHKI